MRKQTKQALSRECFVSFCVWMDVFLLMPISHWVSFTRFPTTHSE